MTAPGRHGLLDLYGCDENILRDAARAAEGVEAAVQHGGAGGGGGLFEYGLQAGGVAQDVFVAAVEVEHRYAAADIFLCGHMPAQAARRTIEHGLCARNTRWQSLMRGEAV